MIDVFRIKKAAGHQPSQSHIGDWRPDPSQQSAAVEPLRDEMTIRDKFAADYIQQHMPAGDVTEEHAKRAYEYADTMMKARKEK